MKAEMPATPSAFLTVATFNIRNGRALDGRHAWPRRRRATAATVADLGADVVGLQEAFGFQLRYLLAALPGYRAFGEGRKGGRSGEGCPVLVAGGRFDVVSAETRWYGGERRARLPGASYPRIATLLRLRHRPSGTVCRVVNTHLDEHRLENRRAAAVELAGWVGAGEPTVILGDLNTTEDDDAVFGALAAAGLRPARPQPARGTEHRFTGATDGDRIDHVLVSGHFQVRAAEVMTTRARPLPSDHWPVRVVLEIA